MKRLQHELQYPGRTVEEVAAMLTDPAFRKAVADYQQTLRNEATVTPDGGGHTVLLEYAHGTDRVPSFARKFVGEEIPIRQVERWSADHTADIEVTIPGKPGEISGSALLDQRGEIAVETVDLSVRVGIPLVGGKIEDLIAGLLLKAFKAENKVGTKWLAGEWT